MEAGRGGDYDAGMVISEPDLLMSEVDLGPTAPASSPPACGVIGAFTIG